MAKSGTFKGGSGVSIIRVTSAAAMQPPALLLQPIPLVFAPPALVFQPPPLQIGLLLLIIRILSGLVAIGIPPVLGPGRPGNAADNCPGGRTPAATDETAHHRTTQGATEQPRLDRRYWDGCRQSPCEQQALQGEHQSRACGSSTIIDVHLKTPRSR